MTTTQVTRRLLAGLIVAAGLAATPAIAMASAPPSPPPIEDIAAQYGTETGATYISCSPYPDQTVCYGIGTDGAVIGARYADGAFTPITAGAAEAAGEATTTTVASGAPPHWAAVLMAGELNLLDWCPLWEADSQGAIEAVTADLGPLELLNMQLELGIDPSIDLEAELVKAFSNRMAAEC